MLLNFTKWNKSRFPADSKSERCTQWHKHDLSHNTFSLAVRLQWTTKHLVLINLDETPVDNNTYFNISNYVLILSTGIVSLPLMPRKNSVTFIWQHLRLICDYLITRLM